MQRILGQSSGKPDHDSQVDITDAAMLMAADGYGHGKIIGEQNGEEVVIRTSDTHKSFLFAKEPDPSELAEAAANLAWPRVWQSPVRSAAADDCATQGRHLEPEQSAAAGAHGFWRWLDRQSGSAARAARPLS